MGWRIKTIEELRRDCREYDKSYFDCGGATFTEDMHKYAGKSISDKLANSILSKKFTTTSNADTDDDLGPYAYTKEMITQDSSDPEYDIY